MDDNGSSSDDSSDKHGDEDDFTEFEIDSDVERENPGANEPKADSDEDSDIQVSLERVLCYV